MIWEQIDPYHKRCKIEGGWLVKAYEDVVHLSDSRGVESGYDWNVAMCFVPDPRHTWRI